MSASFHIALQHLAGNPIPVTFTVPPAATVEYRVIDLLTNHTIHTALVTSVGPTQTININRLFSNIAVGDGVKKYNVVMFIDGAHVQTSTIEVYPGAVSKRLFRELAKKSLDIFTTKLNPSDRNFLLTTRTFGRVIVVPEDELLPLPFYRRGKNFSVFGQNFNFPSDGGQTVGYLLLDKLRKDHFTQAGELTNVIPVLSGADTAFTVVIGNVVTPHTCFIKFRNSLGAQEMIALQGDIDFIPSFEQQHVGVYDHLAGDVIHVPFSVTQKSKYVATLRPLRPDEALFAVDMLLSREHFLVTPKGEFQVIVRPSAAVPFHSTSTKPISIPIEIEAIDEERYYSPINIEQLSFIYENIFTHEFTTQFT